MRSSSVCKAIPGLLLVCLFLISGVQPAFGADKLQPLTLSVNITYFPNIDDKVLPGPWVYINSGGLIVVDTTTGQVVSSGIMTQQGVMLPLVSQQTLGSSTQLTFGATVSNPVSFNLTLTLALPASLVGYTGGPISGQEQWFVNACSGLGCTSGGTASGNLTPYPSTCIGIGCFPPPSNPAPFLINPLVPSAAAPGGPAFTLTVNGTGFVPGAVVIWNGSPRVTNFVTSSQLTAAILASDIATAQTAAITVVNPGPGSGLSNPIFFPVTNPTRDVAFQNGAIVNGSSGFAPGLQVVVGDFTGTGKLDLVSDKPTAANGVVPSYWRGNGDGTFQSGVPFTMPNSFTTNDIAVGDLNGDGNLDVVFVGHEPTTQSSQAAISVFLGNGNGTFSTSVSTVDSTITGLFSLALGDVNGDGKLDLVGTCTNSVPNAAQQGICVFLGNGDGTFHLSFSQFYGSPLQINSLVLGDFNGDGKLDIVGTAVVGNQFGNPTYMFLLPGNGDGTFAADQILYETTNSGQGHGVVGAADLNHDGTLDLVFVHDACLTTNPCTWSVDFFPGNGNGTFQPPITATGLPAPTITGLGGLARPIFGDFNGDGNLDVAIGNTVFLLSNGASRQYSIPQGGYAAGDFNGDGRLDLITSAGTFGQFVLQPLLQALPAPDFTSSGTPPYLTVVTGGTASFTVNITGVNGFTGTVQPSLTGLPAGTSVSFNPPTVTGSGSIVVSIAASSSTPTGTYPLTGALTSGSIVHSGGFNLNVGPAGTDFTDFYGTFDFTYQNISPGGVGTYNITIHPVNGFTGTVSFSLSGLPSGATATFNPPTVTGGSGTTTLTVTTSFSTPNGQYQLSVTGTSGSHTHNATLILNVNPPGTYFGDFYGTITPTSQTIKVGQTANFAITIYPLYGFNENGQFLLLFPNGFPAGIHPTQNPPPGPGPWSFTLSFLTDSSLAPGTYTITFREQAANPPTNSAAGHNGTITLIVTP